jgi:hypothetical protein
MTISASVGFDEAGRPQELFLSGAKDASVVISVCAAAARDSASGSRQEHRAHPGKPRWSGDQSGEPRRRGTRSAR